MVCDVDALRRASGNGLRLDRIPVTLRAQHLTDCVRELFAYPLYDLEPDWA